MGPDLIHRRIPGLTWERVLWVLLVLAAALVSHELGWQEGFRDRDRVIRDSWPSVPLVRFDHGRRA